MHIPVKLIGQTTSCPARGHYWLKISFLSPAHMELCPGFNLVIMPLYVTAYAQICHEIADHASSCQQCDYKP